MMHGADATAVLKQAQPFDRAFIDEMVPHHQGAIRMARAVLERTEDQQIQRVAKRIVAAQSREIREMNRWRRAWFGAASPSGGVPDGGARRGMDAGEAGMGHEGH